MVQKMHDQGYNVNEKELKCISQNVYFEARGESVAGQIYVANVTMNRVKNDKWPKTICDVVYQPYQFSWTINKKYYIDTANSKIENNKNSRELWKNIVETSALVMTGLINDQTHGATHYHNKTVKPDWTKSFVVTPTMTASAHIFYKDKS